MVKAAEYRCPCCGKKAVIIAQNDVAFGFDGGKVMRAPGLEYRQWKCNDCDGEIAEAELPDEIREVLVGIREEIEQRLDNWKWEHGGEGHYRRAVNRKPPYKQAITIGGSASGVTISGEHISG